MTVSDKRSGTLAGASRKVRRTARRLFGRLLVFSYKSARPAARLLPPPVRTRLVGLLTWTERVSVASMEDAFRTRLALVKLKPLLSPKTFIGPTILVNNALAWGGVERQIVYTLLGLHARSADTHGLLCMRLGLDLNHDFYRSALGDFTGFIRNVVPRDEAVAVLETDLTDQQRRDIADCIGWFPPDAQEEIQRFVADFLRLRPRVVHVWQDGLSITAGFAARIAGVPRIIVSGRNVAPIHFAYHRAHMSYGYAELASCTDIIMLNNSEAGRRSYAAWLGLPEQRFEVLRNGIDTETISRPAPADVNALRDKLGIPADAPVVGSIFRLYDEKRPLLWMETAAIVARERPDVHFVVFGGGPLREQMLQIARRSGLEHRLHLPGTIDKPSLGLGLFDCFLLTSEFEGTPNVVLEASLMGVPVVATEAGGTAETIGEGETGYVVSSASPNDLAARIVEILDDPSFVRQVAQCGPRFVLQRFGLRRMIDETVACYGRGPETRTAP